MPQAMVSGLFAVMFGIIAVRLLLPALPCLTLIVTERAAPDAVSLQDPVESLHLAFLLWSAVACLQAVGLSQLQYVDQNR